jgi:hypothetical protein
MTRFLPAAPTQMPYPPTHGGVLSTTLDDERRELFESVLEAAMTFPDDTDHRAACSQLLRHLARTSGIMNPGSV